MDLVRLVHASRTYVFPRMTAHLTPLYAAWPLREAGPMAVGAVHSYLVASGAAAAVVLFGALYALLLALSRLQRSPFLMLLAGAAYLLLVASTVLIVRALDLHGAWLAVPVALLAGYLFAPHAVWRMCVGIEGESHESATRKTRGGSP
jgi:hypothetical protein